MKQALIFAPAEEIFPGVMLTGMHTVRATPRDAEKIAFGLDQALAAPRKNGKPKKGAEKQTHPIGALAEQLLHEVTPEIDGRHLDEVIEKAITASGVRTLSEGKDDGPLAVWSDDLEPWVGNPLLIETRAGRCGTDRLEQVIAQVQRWIEARGAMWGLFLHPGQLPDSVKARLRGTTVLAMSVDEFLRALKDEGFADVVRRLRNDRVHGKAKMPAYSRPRLGWPSQPRTRNDDGGEGQAAGRPSLSTSSRRSRSDALARDKKNAFRTEEIDVAFWNEQEPDGLKAFDETILTECKNWSKPVGSMEVNWF
jgi:hypothetical protein